MQFNLIKFNNKLFLRYWLRSLPRANISKSSIYLHNQKSYIIIGTEHLLIINQPVNESLTIINKQMSATEKFIYQWGENEIKNSLLFVKLENDSIYHPKGRQITYNKQVIIRSFLYLPEIFAILNYNSDSFSDGGRYNTLDSAYKRVVEHIEMGAEIIDIGVESTRPSATPLIPEKEIKILKNLLPEILKLKQHYKFKISIDTYHETTISWLINCDYDINIINDVSGNLNLDLVKQLTNNHQQYLAMHSLSIPPNSNNVIPSEQCPVKVIYEWISNKLDQMDKINIDLQKIIFDCGIGFGKNSAQSWYLLNHLDKFQTLPCETLLGHSRKSFLKHILNNNQVKYRDIATMIITAQLINQVDYFRLHDLSLLNNFYSMFEQLKR